MTNDQHAAFLAARGIAPPAAVAAGLASDGDDLCIPYPASDFVRRRNVNLGEAPGGETTFTIAGGGAPRAYVPAALAHASTATGALKWLLIVSDEIDALAVCGHDIACAAGPVDQAMVDLAKQFAGVVMLFPSDVKTRPAARAAAITSVQRLREACPETAVLMRHCPPPKELGIKADRVDVGAWMAREGGFTWAMRARLQEAVEEACLQLESARQGGFIALGMNKQAYVVYSPILRAKCEYSATDLGKSSNLMSIVGLPWAQTHFEKPGKPGQVYWEGVEWAIKNACSQAGTFESDRVRGAGVWLDRGQLVINSRECLYADGSEAPRVGEQVYDSSRDLRINLKEQPASVADMELVLKTLRGWTWKRPTDVYVLVGWLMLGYVAGALEWRPHVYLHGEPGSGKSTLVHLLKALLGRSCHTFGKVTEPALRRAVGQDALALLLDEQEAKGRGSLLDELLPYLRLCSGGTTQEIGSREGKGTERFVLRSMGLLAAIVPPRFANPADSSRFMLLSLAGPVASGGEKDPLVEESLTGVQGGRLESLGRGIAARMIQSWDRYNEALQVFKASAPAGTERMQNVVCPLLAASWIAFHDEAITRDAAKTWTAMLDVSEDVERMSTASDALEFWQILLEHSVNMPKGGRRQIGELIDMSVREHARGPASKELQRFGLRVMPDLKHLAVHCTSTTLQAVFRDTKYEGGNLRSMFSRLEGAADKLSESSMRFGGGITAKYLVIPWDPVGQDVQYVEDQPALA